MEKIKLTTESYLFNGQHGIFRAIPFYELSMDEYIVYEDGKATYYVNGNRQNDPIVKALRSRISYGESIEDFFNNLGRKIDRNWTTRSGLSEAVENSWQDDQIELYLLTDLNDLK